MQTTTLLKFSSSNWFLAKIVYHIISGEGNHTPQFDEQLRLIQAENELQAIQKARQTGEKEEAEQREHSSGRGAADGGFIAAP